MAKLTDITDRPMRAGHWHSEDDGGGCRIVYHYSTRMLTFEIGSGQVQWAGTGNGSVSDQGGMNKLFRKLGSRAYFVRRGGARIEGLYQ